VCCTSFGGTFKILVAAVAVNVLREFGGLHVTIPHNRCGRCRCVVAPVTGRDYYNKTHNALYSNSTLVVSSVKYLYVWYVATVNV